MALVFILIVENRLSKRHRKHKRHTFFSFCFVLVALPSFSRQAPVYGRAGTAVA